MPNAVTYPTSSFQYQYPPDLTHDFDQISSSSTDFYEQMITNNDSEPHYLSFQEIMELVGTPPATVKSLESQVSEQSVEQNDYQEKLPVRSIIFPKKQKFIINKIFYLFRTIHRFLSILKR